MNSTNNEQIMDFEDNKTVPFETRVYYSKEEAIFGIFLGGLLAAFLIILLVFMIQDAAFIILNAVSIVMFCFLLFMVLLGIYLAYACFSNYKKAIKKVAQIILNEEGLQTENSKFTTWDTIKSVDIILDGSKYCLLYDYDGGREKFSFYQEYYDLKAKELTKLLKIYRGRFEINRLKNSEKND
jgi:hypothetical protein